MQTFTFTVGELAAMAGVAVQVQELIGRHHAAIEHFYEASAESYAGLAQLYVGDPEFHAFYDRYREGLTAFLSDAMTHYAINMLSY